MKRVRVRAKRSHCAHTASFAAAASSSARRAASFASSSRSLRTCGQERDGIDLVCCPNTICGKERGSLIRGSLRGAQNSSLYWKVDHRLDF
eukprot:1545016-Pleurochrysis_carterae.AAC.1